MDRISKAAEAFDGAVDRFEASLLDADAYMPALATRLRLIADEMADRYPDDANGGIASRSKANDQ